MKKKRLQCANESVVSFQGISLRCYYLRGERSANFKLDPRTLNIQFFLFIIDYDIKENREREI